VATNPADRLCLATLAEPTGHERSGHERSGDVASFFDGIETGIGKRILPSVGFPRETPVIAGLSRVKPPSGGGLWRQTPVI
jgi:hypothetical protein